MECPTCIEEKIKKCEHYDNSDTMYGGECKLTEIIHPADKHKCKKHQTMIHDECSYQATDEPCEYMSHLLIA